MEDPLERLATRIESQMSQFENRMDEATGKIDAKLAEGPPLPSLPGENGSKKLPAPPAPPKPPVPQGSRMSQGLPPPPEPKAPGTIAEEFVDTVPTPNELVQEAMYDVESVVKESIYDFQNMPKQTLEDGVEAVRYTKDTLVHMPREMSNDMRDGVMEFTKAPAGVLKNVSAFPAKVLGNANDIVKTVLEESVEIKGKSPKDRGDAMRTITDFIPFI